MRKLLFSLFLLLSSVGVSVNLSAQDAPRVIKWQKVSNWKIPGIQVYVDVNTVKRNENDIALGAFLFYRKTSIDTEVQGKTIQVSSFVRLYAVDCKKELMLPAADYYFNLPSLPVITDVPIVAIDYSNANDEPKEISKQHPIYKTLCPSYL